MVITLLVIAGLVLGSFVNALVWRLHEGRDWVKERSECVHCHHVLAAKDLVPVLSWLSLRGRCRYCHKPISVQYPLIETTTAGLFVLSYLTWPVGVHGAQTALFILWLVILVGLIALLVYDLRWMLLPNRLMFPLLALAAIYATISILTAGAILQAFANTFMAVLVGGGLFYIIFQVSAGKWIGGGDVKLGFLLGLLVATPARSLLFIFLAAVLGSLVSLPLMVAKQLKRNSVIPFGPFLIIGGSITVLFGSSILNLYSHIFLGV